MSKLLAPSLLLSLLLTCSALSSEAKPLTLYEERVQPYLLEDVKHDDAWPDNGWELFGLTEDEIQTKYQPADGKSKSNPCSYKKTDAGGELAFNYGQAWSVFDLVYDDDGKVNSVAGRIAADGLPQEGGNKWHLNDRAEGLHEALNSANKKLYEYTNDKSTNPGFIWWAYRNRARIYLAMGRDLEAQKDIKAAEYYEAVILKDPKKARKDNRPSIVI